jgi:uroporphyrin-III C-methyltransferase/precorrin-2 dehydrogenase/sirohydrochlorin ferrochelatase
MGLKGIDVICTELVRHGMSGQTPVALVEQGTTPRQRVWVGTLASLPEALRHEDVHAPTLIIVGEVVKLHEQLKWFEPMRSAT